MDISCITVPAAKIAAQFRPELSSGVTQQKVVPKLVSFLANKDPAAVKYAEWTGKACEEMGIQFEIREVSRELLEDNILLANEDESIHGIMVYYPVFGGGHDQYLQNLVSPLKDVEGLCHTYRFNMYHNIRYLESPSAMKLKCIIPCTPLAIIKILDYCKVYNTVVPYGNQLHGKTITIINRSEVVGRPLAALLANDGARVYSVDLDGILEFYRGSGLRSRKHGVADTDLTLEQVLPRSDVVITGVPVESYKVSSELLKDGVVAVNFSSWQNFETTVKEKASLFVPSCGKCTVTMLQRNLLRLCDYQQQSQN